MNPPILPDAAFPYKDRKTGLIVFGIFTVLLGCLCGLFVPLMFFGQSMAAKSGGPAMPSMLPAVIMYGGLAIVLVWLGIGSMMARRWARAILLIFSWSWLLVGLLSLVMMAFMLPSMLADVKTTAPSDPPPTWAFVVFPMIFLGIFMVVVPGVWVLFYRSPHVKATCEALDPVPRWTDRCPLPVLGLCLWILFSVPMMLMMGFAYHGVLPAFGVLLSGPVGAAIYFLIAAIWAYCAWSLYRLERIGWWGMLVTVALFGVSAFITYSRLDIAELYRLMGYSEEMIKQIMAYSFIRGKSMAWMSLTFPVPFVAYLLYVRKYLRNS